jgi:ribonuclease T1
MNRRNEWLGILAVLAFIVVLGAIQFWPSSNAPESAVRADTQTESSPTLDEPSQDSQDFGTSLTEGDRADSFNTEIVYDWIIDVAELPDEAINTLLLIDDGGPYPYSQDGSTFQNRERLLPDQGGGYYQEFTVDTPGLNHRGPLRIVTGADGEMFWTDDHYESFAQIVGW